MVVTTTGAFTHYHLDEVPNNLSGEEIYQRLMSLGGFPEPLIQGDQRNARRWRRERFDRILKEDIRDLDNIQNIQTLILFVDALRQRGGSLLTISNLARDLDISPKTAKAWLELCEKMYLCFSIRPYTTNIARSIQKPPKVYFYDNADLLSEGGARLENLVATHLLKRLHFLEDYEGFRCSLHYIRDRDGREVDFLTVVDGVPEDLIEVKTSDTAISNSLRYYADKIKPKRAIQIIGGLDRSFHNGDIFVTDPITFFKV